MNIINKLKKQPQPQQRTEEWYKQRNTKLTASEISNCIPKIEQYCKDYIDEFKIKNLKYSTEFINPYSTKIDYIVNKCKSFYGENVFETNECTSWGNKYENVATLLYSNKYNTVVHEFGLLEHSKYKWLGASPDGISEKGVLLEIKCPLKRKISKIPPLYYWTQMQLQMEVCNIDVCDFMECEIDEIDFDKWNSLNISTSFQHLGIIMAKSDNTFLYPDLTICEKQDYIKWRDEQLTMDSTMIPIYYFIKKYIIIRVKRSNEWFKKVFYELRTTWEIIEYLQKDKSNFDLYMKNLEPIIEETICLL